MFYTGFSDDGEGQNRLAKAIKDWKCYRNIENVGSAAIRIGFWVLAIVFSVLAILGLINLLQTVIA